MDKFISFLKRNLKKIIVILMLLVVLGVLIFASYKLFKYLTPDTKNSVYGDRCELTDGIEITKERKDMIKETVEKNEGMTVKNINIKCNLVDIIIVVDDATEVKTVKTMADEILTVFTEEELKYYDLELMVDSNNEESEVYPIMGTRRKSSNSNADGKFIW